MDGKKLSVRTDKIHEGALGSIYHYRALCAIIYLSAGIFNLNWHPWKTGASSAWR